MPDKPTSREATDFFGNKKGGTEHFDESGEKTGESREATDLFGNKRGYTEHLDKSGEKTGESREATDFFGNEKGYAEHFDADGNKTGETREATDFFGNKREFVEHFDKSGRKIGESREDTGIFGNKRGYVEHTVERKSSSASGDSDITDAAGKLIGGAIVIFGGVFLIIMALAITIILLPIWLGAVTAGVVSGYFLAIRVAARISNETFSEAPVFEQKKGKGIRYRLHNTFFKSAVRFSPDVLSLIGITLIYTMGMAVWPFLGTKDVFTQVLLGVGALAGVILGTMAGRRVLCWQLENLLFARANLKEPTRLVAPKMALGFSIPGLIILAGGWICVFTQSSAPLDLAKEFGFKNNPPSRSTNQREENSPANSLTIVPTSSVAVPRLPISNTTLSYGSHTSDIEIYFENAEKDSGQCITHVKSFRNGESETRTQPYSVKSLGDGKWQIAIDDPNPDYKREIIFWIVSTNISAADNQPVIEALGMIYYNGSELWHGGERSMQLAFKHGKHLLTSSSESLDSRNNISEVKPKPSASPDTGSAEAAHQVFSSEQLVGKWENEKTINMKWHPETKTMETLRPLVELGADGAYTNNLHANGRWNIDGDVLTITSSIGWGTDKYKIISLNENDLVWVPISVHGDAVGPKQHFTRNTNASHPTEEMKERKRPARAPLTIGT